MSDKKPDILKGELEASGSGAESRQAGMNQPDPLNPTGSPTAPTELAQPAVYSFGPFTLDVTARRLTRDGTIVPMTAKVFDTLLVLVREHERTVTKDELLHAVWQNTFVSDESLVQNISAIRRALGDDPSEPQYIATLARRGYRFIAAVREQTNAVAPAASSAPVATGEALPVPTEGAPHSSRSIATRLGLATLSRPWVAACGAFAAGVVLTVLLTPLVHVSRATPAVSRPAMRFREVSPPNHILAEGAELSPDGRMLAFVASDVSGERQLWLRMLDSDTARPIEGTRGALAPFWSPDSANIAYFVGNHIKRVSPSGGPARPIAAVQRGLPLGGAWTRSNQILFCDRGKIFAVNASGGTPVVVIEPTPKLTGDFRWPRPLPDGRHFLFVVSSDNAGQSGTYLGTLGSPDVVRVLNSADSPVEYAPPGYLLYVRDHVLMAQEFNLTRGLKGDPRPILGDISGTVDLSATSGGVLAVNEYAYGARAVSVDRSGRELSAFKVPSLFRSVAISPDDTQVLATSFEGGSLALWQIDLERTVSTRLMTNAGSGVWSPDGSRFAYVAVGTGGAADVAIRSTTGTDSAVWLKTDVIKAPTDWSADGRYILFTNNALDNRRGVWMLPTAGDHVPKPLVTKDGSTCSSGRLSPDGRAVAYVSDETGIPEVYVTPFPVPSTTRQVSAGGGSQPVWRRDGRELFYLSADHRVTAVAVPGDHLAPGKHQPLFPAPLGVRSFLVTRDGQRFLLIVRDPTGDRGAISILTDWMNAL